MAQEVQKKTNQGPSLSIISGLSALIQGTAVLQMHGLQPCALALYPV